jgi:hypothetical protein
VSGRTKTSEQKLHEKLFKARKEAEAVVKKGDGGDFDYARFEDVTAEASRLLDKHRISIEPEVVDEAVRLIGRFAVAKVAMEFEVIDLSTGHSMKKRWSGTADDEPGGKALFKAQTGCEKYFLLKLLRITFGNDPEEKDAAPDAGGETAEAQRVREEQDQAAEAPQAPRHLKPVPQSDLPEPDWGGLDGQTEEEAHV